VASVPSPHAPGLIRCLGPLAVTVQAVATVAFILSAVINIPEAVYSAGHAIWVCSAIALVAIVLVAFDPVGDTAGQIRSALKVAMLSFIGFESAATLGAESLRPERAIPRAIRLSVQIPRCCSVQGGGAHGGLELVAGGPAERT
jgi:amino acid transporter